MKLPMVAILGRPNVGKSSLFNALVRSRVAIVDPTAGVTRDRVSMILKAGARRCELVDTGGIGIVDKQGLAEEIEEQISIAIHEADLVLFVVDGRDGLMPADREIAERLRKVDKPRLLIVNKIDQPHQEALAGTFYALGFGEPIAVGAQTSRGVGELREMIEERLPDLPVEEEPDDRIRFAVVGRTNAGKSTFVNRLFGEQRMIVSDVPGTTRDAVDLPLERDGRQFIAVDTAGMRKKASVSGSPDFYGQARAERAIRRSQVVLFLIDATEPIGRIERVIGQKIIDAHRPAVVVLNKWDLVREERSLDDFTRYLQDQLPMLLHCPLTCISAKEGFRLDELLNLVVELHGQASQRMTTAEIMKVLRLAMEKKGPPTKGGRTGRIYYATQIDIHPPTLVLFINEARLLGDDYRRFLIRCLRENGPFPEIPIRFLLREREDAGRRKGK